MTGETLVVALLMAGLGGGCLFLTLLTLPGNWAILILVGAAQLWSLSGDGAPLYSGWTLVALFALLAGYSALQLVRMQRAQPRALTPQKLVHLLALLCALRE